MSAITSSSGTALGSEPGSKPESKSESKLDQPVRSELNLGLESRSLDQTILNLDPEIETGNIEYKRHVLGLTPQKIFKFGAQMLWRIAEGYETTGHHEAYYYIGIEDDGKISGMSKEIILDSLLNIQIISQAAGIYIVSTQIKHELSGSFALVRIAKEDVRY